MRERIVEAATHMFVEEGYEKVSIRRIAEQIEYSPATIYLYFKDKDELFYEIHERGFDLLVEQMQTIRDIENPYERLRKLGDVYMQFAYENPEYYDLMFIMQAPMDALKKGHQQESWDCGFEAYYQLKNLVQACIEGGYMKPIDVEVASLSVWSFMHGLTSLAIRNRFDMYSREQATQLTKAAIDQMFLLLKKE